MSARYDGLAEWYDEFNAEGAAGNAPELAELLGPGDGPCLDLGCGTGHYLGTIRATGRTVVGLDRSADQLRLARRRDPAPLLQGDGHALPFGDGAFGTVTALWLSTDIPDFAALTKEAARVLRPGGLLLFYGVQPCFNGPHIEKREDGAVTIIPRR
ncbi:class I SAM-dependent methyltransferase [Nonomuraea harbinensis]|uniref:Class I SAM-dependent methyltransferase n=1 Tax=Nonomuraea harbinensis TaxID=1286938 RepID=A0ABW1BW52_9ACTN|nr:class I SAM-dependent methyltransferase [Nonomuraea harbinensis]